MSSIKIGFPHNLLISVKIGKEEIINNGDGTLSCNIPLLINESLLFKFIKKVGRLWQADY